MAHGDAPHTKEFGGTLGTIGIMVGLPVVIYALFFLCNRQYCLAWNNIPEAFSLPLPSWDQLWDSTALLIVVAWVLALVVLERILPGPVAEGMPLRDGSRLRYRLNGHATLWVVAIGLACLQAVDAIDLTYCYTHFVPLATASMALVSILCVALYAASFRTGALLAGGGNTGSAPYDFFIGRELNPRIGDFDLKEFCELRPGLIGWAVLNVGMLLAKYRRDGVITPSMALINLFQGMYVLDAVYQEGAILSTMDITTDGFGFMLAFGDLAWVPFTYSLQARFLVDHDPGFSWAGVIPIAILNVVGYVVFRRSNSQKDAFRRDPEGPSVRHLRSLPTKRGTRLLTSGWWGLARKINYTGDWFMGLSWCLLCGFQSPIPYFYSAYFLVLLVQRAMRDNAACAIKYGEDWRRYTELVPYIFIPYII